MEQGWIKLYRKMWENPVVTKDAEYLAVWVWILTHATHQPYDIMVEGKVITLMPGQVRASRDEIAKRLKVSSSKVQRILKTLENERIIEQITGSRIRIISVLHWSKYQESEPISEPIVNSYRTHSEPIANANKNIRTKEYKNIRNSSSTEKTNIWSSLSQDDFATIEEKFGADRAVELVDLVHEEVDRYGRHVEKPLQYVLSYAERKGIK